MRRRLVVLLAGLASLLVQPAFAGVGADKYHTREPAQCDDRSTPPDPQTAAQYFACDSEGEGSDLMYLVGNVKVQVAKPRAFNIVTDSFSGVDPEQPIYDIRGSFRHWQCSSTNSLTWDNSPEAACNAGDEPHATGECYADTFGDWHCLMSDFDNSAYTEFNVPPPSE